MTKRYNFIFVYLILFLYIWCIKFLLPVNGSLIYGDFPLTIIYGLNWTGINLRNLTPHLDFTFYQGIVFSGFILLLQNIFSEETTSRIFVILSFYTLCIGFYEILYARNKNMVVSVMLSIIFIGLPIFNFNHSNFLLLYSIGFFLLSISNIINNNKLKLLFIIFSLSSFIYIQFTPLYILIWLAFLNYKFNGIIKIKCIFLLAVVTILGFLPAFSSILSSPSASANLSNYLANYDLAVESAQALSSPAVTLANISYSSLDAGSMTSYYASHKIGSILAYIFFALLNLYLIVKTSYSLRNNLSKCVFLFSILLLILLAIGPLFRVNLLFQLLWDWLPGFQTFRTWSKFSVIYVILLFLVFSSSKKYNIREVYLIIFFLVGSVIIDLRYSLSPGTIELRSAVSIPREYSAIKGEKCAGSLVIPQNGWLTSYSWRVINPNVYPNDTENLITASLNCKSLFNGANYYLTSQQELLSAYLYTAFLNKDFQTIQDFFNVIKFDTIFYDESVNPFHGYSLSEKRLIEEILVGNDIAKYFDKKNIGKLTKLELKNKPNGKELFCPNIQEYPLIPKYALGASKKFNLINCKSLMQSNELISRSYPPYKIEINSTSDIVYSWFNNPLVLDKNFSLLNISEIIIKNQETFSISNLPQGNVYILPTLWASFIIIYFLLIIVLIILAININKKNGN